MMTLLTEFAMDKVLKNNYGCHGKSIGAMKKSLKLYIRNRKNPIARSRAKSSIAVIRQLMRAE